jgi:plastocyanin
MERRSALKHIVVVIVIIIIAGFLVGFLFRDTSSTSASDLSLSNKLMNGFGSTPATPHGANQDLAAARTAVIMLNSTSGGETTAPAPSIIPTGTTTITQAVVTITGTTTTPHVSTTTTPVVTMTSTPVVTETSPPSSVRTEISIYGQLFIPRTLTVAQSTTIVWKNFDSVPRYVVSDIGAPTGFNSGEIEPGESFAYTFNLPGQYPYHTGSPKIDHGVIIVV